MEFAACLVGGIALILVGIGLFRLRPPNWHGEGDLTDVDRKALDRWAIVQRVVRTLNNLLLVLIGGMIVATAFVPHGRAWIVLWSTILVLLLVCVLLAMIDAFSSLAGYKRALPGIARRSFADQEGGAVPMDGLPYDSMSSKSSE